MSTLDGAKSVGLPYKAEASPAVNLSDLEDFHERHARDTRWARVVLLTLIFGMLGLNLWMTHRNYTTMMIDIDASRMAMSELNEQTTIRLEAMERRLVTIESRLPVPASGAVALSP